VSETTWRTEAEELRKPAPRRVLFLCVASSARRQMAKSRAPRRLLGLTPGAKGVRKGLTRAARFAAKTPAIAADLELRATRLDHELHAVPDDTLRLIFTCCHPALALEAQIALTITDEYPMAQAVVIITAVAKPSQQDGNR